MFLCNTFCSALSLTTPPAERTVNTNNAPLLRPNLSDPLEAMKPAVPIVTDFLTTGNGSDSVLAVEFSLYGVHVLNCLSRVVAFSPALYSK